MMPDNELESDPEVHVEIPEISTEISLGVINAYEVNTSGAVAQVYAHQLNLNEGAILLAQTGSIDLREGAIFAARAEQLSLNESAAMVIQANQASLEESTVNLLLARSVQANTIKTKVLLCGQVNGDVETMLDVPRTLLGGLAAGVGVGAVLLLSKLFFGRKR
jgi:hypothetical protein